LNYYAEIQTRDKNHEQEKGWDLPIPSDMFIFDTRWFEQVGIGTNDDDSSNNDTSSSTNGKSTLLDDGSDIGNQFDNDNKALVLAPPRKIIKALEDKIALEQSGQFVVGENLDSDLLDILRDPLGFFPKDATIKKDSSYKHTSSFRRDTFSKLSATFLEGTRKRQLNLFKTENEESNKSQNIKDGDRNNRASIIDGFVSFIKVILRYIGEFERILQENYLLPNYKNTILHHSSDKDDGKEDIIKFHSGEENYFEGSAHECNTKHMEQKHQRCVVKIKSDFSLLQLQLFYFNLITIESVKFIKDILLLINFFFHIATS
jgi:hypothetical protein